MKKLDKDLLLAFEEENFNAVKTIFKHKNMNWALRDGAGNSIVILSLEDISTLRECIQHVDINAQNDIGMTALGLASYDSKTEIVELLLAYGANPHIGDKKINFNAIDWAIIKKNLPISLMLTQLSSMEQLDKYEKELRKKIEFLSAVEINEEFFSLYKEKITTKLNLDKLPTKNIDKKTPKI